MDEILTWGSQYGLPWAIVAWIIYKTYGKNGILARLAGLSEDHAKHSGVLDELVTKARQMNGKE